MLHGHNRTVDAEHLVVARHYLARAARSAVVEQDEVLDQIEQPLLGEHAIEQRLRIQTRLVRLGVALPLDEVFPATRDRAIARLVAIAHHQKGVVMKGVGDAVLGQVVGKVVVEAGADVAIHRLQLDEDQRQAIHETHQVGAAVVMRHPHALHFQLAHREEAVITDVTEIDDLDVSMARLAARLPPLDRHAAADETVELVVVLDEGACEVDAGELGYGLLSRSGRQVGVQPLDGGAEIAHQHDLTFGSPAQGAGGAEDLGVIGVETLPAQRVAQMVGEGLLDQAIFAVDVGDGHRARAFWRTFVKDRSGRAARC